MNKNISIIVGVLVLVLIAGGVYMSINSKGNVVMDQKNDDAAMMQKEETVVEESAMTEKSDVMEKTETAAKAGSYEAYAPEKIARAEAEDVVLFFYASWCPSCRGLNSDIESNLNAIPMGVSILKTDYDKETELKKKYGVTYQHTLVQVDKDGNMIKKWSGGPKLSGLLAEIQ